MYAQTITGQLHGQASWQCRVMEELNRAGAVGFRDHNGELILLSRSVKARGQWQATWFRRQGPYTDALAPTAAKLLNELAPRTSEWLPAALIDRMLMRLLSSKK